MNIYSIGYNSHEESEYWQYMHENDYTKEELAEIVEACIYDTLEHFADHPKNKQSLDNVWIGREGPTGQDVMGHHSFHEALIGRGFEKIQFMSTFSIFGWPSCIDKEDWDGQRTEYEQGMCDRLAEKLEDNGIAFVGKGDWDAERKFIRR